MSLDTATVRNIAELARIDLADAELPHLAGELSGILNFVEQLSAVPTDGVAPLYSVLELYGDGATPLRDDVVNDGGQQAAVLTNAPQAAEGFFTVPKVVE